jgi:hypothetical protein
MLRLMWRGMRLRLGRRKFKMVEVRRSCDLEGGGLVLF